MAEYQRSLDKGGGPSLPRADISHRFVIRDWAGNAAVEDSGAMLSEECAAFKRLLTIRHDTFHALQAAGLLRSEEERAVARCAQEFPPPEVAVFYKTALTLWPEAKKRLEYGVTEYSAAPYPTAEEANDFADEFRFEVSRLEGLPRTHVACSRARQLFYSTEAMLEFAIKKVEILIGLCGLSLVVESQADVTSVVSPDQGRSIKEALLGKLYSEIMGAFPNPLPGEQAWLVRLADVFRRNDFADCDEHFCPEVDPHMTIRYAIVGRNASLLKNAVGLLSGPSSSFSLKDIIPWILGGSDDDFRVLRECVPSLADSHNIISRLVAYRMASTEGGAGRNDDKIAASLSEDVRFGWEHEADLLLAAWKTHGQISDRQCLSILDSFGDELIPSADFPSLCGLRRIPIPLQNFSDALPSIFDEALKADRRGDKALARFLCSSKYLRVIYSMGAAWPYFWRGLSVEQFKSLPRCEAFFRSMKSTSVSHWRQILPWLDVFINSVCEFRDSAVLSSLPVNDFCRLYAWLTTSQPRYGRPRESNPCAVRLCVAAKKAVPDELLQELFNTTMNCWR